MCDVIAFGLGPGPSWPASASCVKLVLMQSTAASH